MNPRETQSCVAIEVAVHLGSEEMPTTTQQSRLDVESSAQSRHAKDRGRRSLAAPVRAERFFDGGAAGVRTEQRFYIASSKDERVQVRHGVIDRACHYFVDTITL